MDLPVRPGDALSQPTRARLFELLTELRRPASTEELSEALVLHPNGVRLHLERLLEAGLVERRRERIARGRPRDAWVLSAEAQPGGDPPTGYADLARWLVRSLAAGGTDATAMEATGHRIGAELASAPALAETGEQRVFDALASLGFQPERLPAGDETLAYRLRNCPYRKAVDERAPLVCALHRGITAGLLEQVSGESSLSGFEPRDPEVAGCLIHMRGPIAREATRSGDAHEEPRSGGEESR